MGFLDKLFGKKKNAEEQSEEIVDREVNEVEASVEEPATEVEEISAPEEAVDVAAEEAVAETTEEVVEEAAEKTVEEEPEEDAPKAKKSFWKRVREGLSKTKNALFGQIDDLLKNFVKVD